RVAKRGLAQGRIRVYTPSYRLTRRRQFPRNLPIVSPMSRTANAHARPIGASARHSNASVATLARCAVGILAGFVFAFSAAAQTAVWWDTNAATAGSSAGTTANGTWDQNTTANWSLDSTGASATGTWQAKAGGSGIATFSAGSNATGATTVTVS